jgi:hypothetical protein
VASYRDGRRLGVYYRLHGIATRLEQQPDGWSISVFDEDKARWAKREWEAFGRDPDDPRFPSLSMPEHILAGMRPCERQVIEMHHRGDPLGQIALELAMPERRVRRVLESFKGRVSREYGP